MFCSVCMFTFSIGRFVRTFLARRFSGPCALFALYNRGTLLAGISIAFHTLQYILGWFQSVDLFHCCLCILLIQCSLDEDEDIRLISNVRLQLRLKDTYVYLHSSPLRSLLSTNFIKHLAECLTTYKVLLHYRNRSR